MISKRNTLIYTLVILLKSGVFIWPIMTLFYLHKGLSFLEIGLLNSIGSIVITVLEVPSGYLSDKIGHKLSSVLSAAMNVVFVLLLIFGKGFGAILASEIVFSIGTCLFSGSHTALLYDSFLQDARNDYQPTLARIGTLRYIVSALTGLLSSVLYQYNVVLPFTLSLIFYAMILIAMLFYKSPVISDPAENDDPGASAMLKLTRHVKNFPAFVCIMIISTLAVVMLSNLMIYQAPYFEALGFPIVMLGVVYFFQDIVASVGSKVCEKLSGRLDSRKTILLIMGSIALLIFACSLIRSAYIVVGLFILISFLNAIVSPILNTALNDAVSSAYRATFLSISSAFDNLVGFATDPLIGWLIDMSGIAMAYRIIGIVSLVMVLIVGIRLYRIHPVIET